MDTRLTRGFLFADLRDYTSFVEAHGDRAAAALLADYRALVRGCVEQFGGAEIRTEGDSFYVVFPSASQAVECGLAITEAARDAMDSGDHAAIRVGIGIHAGETIEGAEGYVGSAVNIASRVAARAAAGEVLVTDTVRNLTRTSLPVAYLPRGRARLKGISERIPLYLAAPSAATSVMVVRRAAAFPRLRPTRWGGIALAVVGGATVAVVGAVLLFNVLRGSEHAGNAGGVGQGPATSAHPMGLIAFSRTVGASRQIFVIDPANGTSHQVTRVDSNTQPAWSPDGKRLAFVRSGTELPTEIYVAQSDGSGAQRLTRTELANLVPASPTWLPGSEGVAYVVCCSNGGGGGVPFVDIGGRPLPSVVPFEGASPGALPEWGLLEPTKVSVTPDGTRVAVAGTVRRNGLDAAQDQQPNLQIVLADRSLEDMRSLVYDVTQSQPFPELNLKVDLRTFDPAWSPDGKKIAFAAVAGNGGGQPDIYVIDVGGGRPVRLTASPSADRAPTWSSDGSHIAFVSDRDGHDEIYVMDSDGGNQTRLTFTPAGVSNDDPAWSPAIAPGT